MEAPKDNEDGKNVEKKKDSGHIATIILGLLTIVVTIVTSIPAFQQLSRDRASVYYESQALSVLNRNDNDFERVKTILQQNNIPDSKAILKIINMGEGVAKEVKAQMTVEGSIIELSTDPKREDNPIWVDLQEQFGDFKGKSTATIEFKNLAPTKPLTINIGYNSSGNPTLNVQPEVFFDHRPGIKIDNISTAPTNTFFQALKLPLSILGIGILLTLIVAAIIVIKRNEALASALWRFFIEAVNLASPFRFPFNF